jgi:hypothetical protein
MHTHTDWQLKYDGDLGPYQSFQGYKNIEKKILNRNRLQGTDYEALHAACPGSRFCAGRCVV